MLTQPIAHIDLGALIHNWQVVTSYLSNATQAMAMVKADAYGHGLVPVAKRLEHSGCAWFGVATPQEAMELRAGGVTGRILLMSPATTPEEATALGAAAIDMVATDAASIERYAAARASQPIRLHLKVDTGMGRLGLPAHASAGLAVSIARASGLELAGVWTHFHDSDAEDHAATRLQLAAFEEACQAIVAAGVEIPLRHTANSAGLIAFPEAHYDLVRPGIVLYGYHSSDYIAALEPRVQPVMRLSAPVTFIKQVPPGTALSYGHLWRTPEATTIATVRIGYADGYPRRLTGSGWAGVGGTRCPVVGRVCMDQLLIAVPADHELQLGDRVDLWGGSGPDAEALARAMDTVSYELLTRLMPRVAREYHG